MGVDGRAYQTAARVLCVGMALIGIAGCTEDRQNLPTVHPPQHPTLVIGIDGFEWDLLLPLIRAGEMPETAKLIERGSYGLLETILPSVSPVIWTSVATGKIDQKHGIHGFTRKDAKGTNEELYNNLDRKTKAVWNIASDYDRRVSVIGWWMTFPADSINGVMVSQTNSSEDFRRKANMPWKGMLKPRLKAQISPAEREAEIFKILRKVQRTLEIETEKIFGKFSKPLSPEAQKYWQVGLWAVRADLTYEEISKRLIQEAPPHDLFMVYFGGTDTFAHRFWRFFEPERFPVATRVDNILNFRNVVNDYYRHMDRVIGKLVALAPGYRILLLSDHGIHPAAAVAHDSQKGGLGEANHKDAPPGVFIAAGPDIVDMSITKDSIPGLERSDLHSVGSIMDMTPTLLALMGLPIGEDMDGELIERVIAPEFLERFPALSRPTHEDPRWSSERLRDVEVLDPDDQFLRERLEQLRALGYLDDFDDFDDPDDE
jgi:predicted AlkP superfamily phosphohydrolase/phosphomutase